MKPEEVEKTLRENANSVLAGIAAGEAEADRMLSAVPGDKNLDEETKAALALGYATMTAELSEMQRLALLVVEEISSFRRYADAGETRKAEMSLRLIAGLDAEVAAGWDKVARFEGGLHKLADHIESIPLN